MESARSPLEPEVRLSRRLLAWVRSLKHRLAPDQSPADRLYDQWLAPWISPWMPELPPPGPADPDLRLGRPPSYAAIENAPVLVFAAPAEPEVTILIPARDHWLHTYTCLDAVRRHTRGSFEVLVVDDGSQDETRRLADRVSGIRLLRNPDTLGFLRSCNRGAQLARGRFLVLLNNDTRVHPGWLDHLLEAVEDDPSVGLVGARLVDASGRLQEAGGIVWSDGSAWNWGRGQAASRPGFTHRREVDYCSAACLLIRREVWEQVGGFDERYAPAFYEDVDLAFSARELGFSTVYQPRAVVTHEEGVSHGRDTSRGLKRFQVRNRDVFRDKWAAVLVSQHSPDAANAFLARERPHRGVVLVVDHSVPTWDVDAGSRAVRDQILLLREEGWKVVLLPFDGRAREPYTTWLQDRGIEVLHGLRRWGGLQAWLAENGRAIDVVWLNRPHVAQACLEPVRRWTTARVIYQAIDLHFLREQRRQRLTGTTGSPTAEHWRVTELSLAERADVAYVFSRREADLLRAEIPGLVVRTLPLCFPERVPLDDSPFERKQDLLFVGGFAHPPNQDAVAWFVAEVWTLLRQRIEGVRLRLAGRVPDEAALALAQTPGVEVLGWVSEAQLAELYRSSRIVVAPMRYGAGVNGKVLEAMSWGVPVVTTPVCVEGIPEPGLALAVADDAPAMVAEIERLYRDPECWSRQRDAALRYLRRHFSPGQMRQALRHEFPVP